MSQWLTKGGTFAFSGFPSDSLLDRYCPFSSSGSGSFKPTTQNLTVRLSHHGYTQWTSYQPGSRFWPFQWIESGWLLLLSALLIAATIWLVRHRAT
jgi:hypothetical protein